MKKKAIMQAQEDLIKEEVEDLSDEELAIRIRIFVKSLNSLLTVARTRKLVVKIDLQSVPLNDGRYRTVYISQITKSI